MQAVTVGGSVGEGLLLAALPLLAVSITTDPREVSLVNVVGQAPWLLFSLFAGVLIDRVRRTTVLAAAYAALAVAALTLALAGSTHLLGLGLLVGVAFVVTSAQVLGDGASGALVPELVGPDALAAANTRLQVINRGVVQFVVPPLTGVLLALGAGWPAWLAFLAAVTALLLARTIPSAAVTVTRRHPMRDIHEGLRYLVRTRLLRAITTAVAFGSFAASAGNAMLVLYATQVLHVDGIGYGVLLACMALGWIGCSFVVGRVVDRLGYAWSMRLAQLATVPAQVLIAVAPPSLVFVGVVVVLMTATTLVWNVCSQSSRQRFTPTALLGRVLTSHRALAWGLTPLGALAGGLVAAHFGLRAVWVMGAVIQAAALALVWRALSPDAFVHAARDLADGDLTNHEEDQQADR
ncbi:putative MFS family arabinose efflux permease [Labedaea rhizosphaerae]|uniref:Putative MFS family arabinose efflux permease n=1 Tax=Labedaea rhizosphaerae TaxID=598644 RepID=A0A4R6S4E9_LABRH|nr:putative MFS family arabinose efflux permease [Labedaea rhizosphaerae]